MGDNIQIKAEVKGKTIGGVAKPKFVPKAQPKRTTEELLAANAANVSSAAAVDASKIEGKVKIESRAGRDNRNRAPNGGRGRDNSAGRGRGRWAMPSGTSFFTGNNAGSKPTSLGVQRSGPLSTGNGSYSGSGSSVTYSLQPTPLPGRVKTEHAPAVFHESWNPQLIDSDSDADDQAKDEPGTKEVWPPEGFNAMDPVSLPFCPRTIERRNEVASMPILAHPDDKRALEIEEQVGAFVLQFPSDLRLPTSGTSAAGDAAAAAEVDASKGEAEASMIQNNSVRGLHHLTHPTLARGKIGKLQYMKSGKLFLVANSGKKYEVNAGIDVAFAQFLAAISVETGAEAEGLTSKPSSSSAAVPESTGKFCMLSDVTRKIVITPTHAIGCRRETIVIDDGNSNQSGAAKYARPTMPTNYFPGSSSSSMVGLPVDSFSSGISTSQPVVKSENLGLAPAISGTGQSGRASKPAVRVRMADDDGAKKVKSANARVAPSAGSKVGIAAGRLRLNSAGKPLSAAEAKADVVKEHSSGIDDISDYADAIYQDEYVHEGGGDDDGDMDVE